MQMKPVLLSGLFFFLFSFLFRVAVIRSLFALVKEQVSLLLGMLLMQCSASTGGGWGGGGVWRGCGRIGLS